MGICANLDNHIAFAEVDISIISLSFLPFWPNEVIVRFSLMERVFRKIIWLARVMVLIKDIQLKFY